MFAYSKRMSLNTSDNDDANNDHNDAAHKPQMTVTSNTGTEQEYSFFHMINGQISPISKKYSNILTSSIGTKSVDEGEFSS